MDSRTLAFPPEPRFHFHIFKRTSWCRSTVITAANPPLPSRPPHHPNRAGGGAGNVGLEYLPERVAGALGAVLRVPPSPCAEPPRWLSRELAQNGVAEILAPTSTTKTAISGLPGTERAIPLVTEIDLATPFEARRAASAVDGGPSSATPSAPVRVLTKSARAPPKDEPLADEYAPAPDREDRRAESAQSGESVQRFDSGSGAEGRRRAERKDRETCASTGEALGAASGASLRTQKRVVAKDWGNDMVRALILFPLAIILAVYNTHPVLAQAISKFALGADTQLLHRRRMLLHDLRWFAPP
ncbi:hypothetical protein DFH11DRAFT_1881024 [Phellopilus nigrolimitatus]|nr:hypothetical protein DFH11DRAFT_1881024 [Phellopilus nigrolimitatus]